jgi:heme-degrading monooxygenase HmoA
MTIVRIWRGVTLATRAERYLEYLNNVVAPAYRTAEANEGMYIMQELQDELTHFLLLSFWTSEEKLKNFAGVDCCEVVVPTPEEKEFLIAFESTARHYSIVYKSGLSRD